MPHAVFVTGASTGIGRCLAGRLGALGHVVFASARRHADLQALAAIERVVPVRLDVRNPVEIAEAVRAVEARGLGLWGLVNNAGIGGIGPIAAWTDDELEEIFAVNALGPVRATRAFLPLILKSCGRVVNVGSQGGSISKKHFGPYTMTKHALEAFTVALAEEIAPFGAHAAIVQPGGVVTAIGRNALAGDLARFRRAPAPFDAEARAIAEAITPDEEPGGSRDGAGHGGTGPLAADPEAAAGTGASGDPPAEEPESETNRQPSSPDLVADAVLQALFDPAPRRRYLVGTRWEGNRVVDALLERLADANACPALGFTYDELAARLASALAAR